ncbi:hypothetical protein ACFYY8_17485 [Streptosporangium sp. NPDC001559]|uniref:hypothetical protein n=1 Tax=Streptosporangium sp. NPDC001559 TaxID=3366187 RepID=UPI0036EA2977
MRVARALSIAGSATATLKVTGVETVPATNVASVALNLSTKATAAGQGALIVYPSDGDQPVGITGARYRGDIWNNDLLMVKVGADGNVKIKNTGALTVTVRADVHGYTLLPEAVTPASAAGSRFVGLTPARILSGKVVPGEGDYTFSPLGMGGVPASGVSHVVFTLVGSVTAATALIVHPLGTVRPTDANLHASPDGYKDNLVIAELGTDGKIVISNTTATPATIWIDVSGYFATPEAAVSGSTLVPVQPTRLVNNVNLGGYANHTFSPLGKGGVPASGVTSVGINLTLRSSTDTGWARVFPTGTAMPDTWTAGYPTMTYYNAGAIVAKLGSDGQITVYNGGNHPVELSVDVYAYTVPACAPPPAPVSPNVDIEQYSPTTVLQASPLPGATLGMLEYAYSDNVGHLVHGRQPSIDDFSTIQWQVISDVERSAVSGRPGMIEQADGRMRVMALTTTGNVWLRPQATKDPPAWSGWTNLGGLMSSPPVVAKRSDNTVVAFAVDAGGTLWASPQEGQNGGQGCWSPLAMTGLTGAPVVVRVATGLQVFARDTAGAVKSGLYAGGSLSGVTSLGGSGLTGAPAVVIYPGSRLRVFARAGDGSILTQIQDTAGDFPGTWEQVGSFVAAGSPSALLSPVTGKVEVVARDANGIVHSTGETTQGSGTWRAWKRVDTAPQDVAATDPTVFTYTRISGQTWAFAFRDPDNRTRVYIVPTDSVAARDDAQDDAVTFVPHTLPEPPK